MKSYSSLAGLAVLCLSAAIGACFTGSSVDVNAVGAGPGASTAGTVPPAAGDLPCDLVDALASCATCHGAPLRSGAPNRLLTHADLAVPSRSDPAQTVAQLSVARMKDSAKPMPPSGVAPGSQVALLEKWIADGMPKDTCGGVDAGVVADTPSVCTSGTHYSRGHSTSMRPGGACNHCHASDEGPIYGAAGTVYPTMHEPDDCNGVQDGSVQVVLTDANGQSFTLPVNSAGNFVMRNAIASPYTAKVVSGTKVRAMIAPQTEGDCNTCHSERGAQSAPGRIMAPQ